MPAEYPIDIHNNINDIAKEFHADLLYAKELTYQASLLRKCTKLYKDTAILTHNYLVEKLKKYAMNPDIEEFDEIYKRDFYSIEE